MMGPVYVAIPPLYICNNGYAGQILLLLRSCVRALRGASVPSALCWKDGSNQIWRCRHEGPQPEGLQSPCTVSHKSMYLSPLDVTHIGVAASQYECQQCCTICRPVSSTTWCSYQLWESGQYWCMGVALRSTSGSTSWALRLNSRTVFESQMVRAWLTDVN